VKNTHRFTLDLAHINYTVNQIAASGTQDPHCTLTTNPDITGLCDCFFLDVAFLSIFPQGIGVRIAMYLQGLITILGPRQFTIIYCT
jgi:hypothetical protein